MKRIVLIILILFVPLGYLAGSFVDPNAEKKWNHADYQGLLNIYRLLKVYLHDVDANTMIIKAPDDLTDDSTIFTFPGSTGDSNKLLYAPSATATAWSLIKDFLIASDAEITRSKLANGTADYVVIHNGTGDLSEEQYLDLARGGTGRDMTGLTVVSTSESQQLTNKYANNFGVEEYLRLKRNAGDASAPGATYTRLYAKDDGEMYYRTNDGIEQILTEENTATLTNKTLTSPHITTPTGINLNDINDVDVSGPESGQALVWNNANSKWEPGASGDSSFKLQSFDDTTITIKSGKIIINGFTYCTYDGSGTVESDINSDLVYTPAGLGASAKYYVYINTYGYSEVTLDSGRVCRMIENDDFHISAENPYDGNINTSQYTPIGIVTTDGDSDIDAIYNDAFRYQDTWKNIQIMRSYYFTDDEKTSSPSGSGTNEVTVTESNATGTTEAEIECTTDPTCWAIGHSYAGTYEVTITHNLNLPINKQRFKLQMWNISNNEIHENEWGRIYDGTNFVGWHVKQISINSFIIEFDRYRHSITDWSAFRWRVIVGVIQDEVVATPTNTYTERITSANTDGVASKHKVTFPAWFDRKDYDCWGDYYDDSDSNQILRPVRGIVYDKAVVGQVTLDLNDLSFAANDYLDLHCGLGPKVVAMPIDNKTIVKDVDGLLSTGKIVVKSANYTITDTDNIRTIECDTSGADRTINFPTLADNLNRIITVVKTSASNKCILNGEGAETLAEDANYYLTGDEDSVTYQAGSTEWKMIGLVTADYGITHITSDVNFTTTMTALTGHSITLPSAGDYQVFAGGTLYYYSTSNDAECNIDLHDGSGVINGSRRKFVHSGSDGGVGDTQMKQPYFLMLPITVTASKTVSLRGKETDADDICNSPGNDSDVDIVVGYIRLK